MFEHLIRIFGWAIAANILLYFIEGIRAIRAYRIRTEQEELEKVAGGLRFEVMVAMSHRRRRDEQRAAKEKPQQTLAGEIKSSCGRHPCG